MDGATDTGPRLPELRTKLDVALTGLRAIVDPAVPVAHAERALGEALEHVYAALADLGDHATFQGETRAAVEDVRAALAHLMAAPSADAGVDQVAAAVAEALGGLQGVTWALAPGIELPRADRATPFLRASVQVPRLLELGRAVLRPAIPLDAPPFALPEPAPEVLPAAGLSLEALRERMAAHAARLEELAKPKPAPAPEPEPEPEPRADDALIRERFGVAITDEALLAERARDCMDDLGMLGRMRRQGDLEPWAAGEECERRMLTKVDAIAACGASVFPHLVHLLDDRPLPDPEMTFGNVYFFLSIAGDDAFDQAARILETAELGEPGMLELCTDALVFAPHPRVDAFMSRWSRSEVADRRALAVEVLRRRRALTRELFDALGGDDDARVLASLARALPFLPGGAPPGALGWFLQRSEEPVVRAAMESAMRLRQVSGYERAVQITSARDGAWAEAVLFVGISGGPEVRAVLEDDIASAGSNTALRAIGWYGDPTFVPFLLGRLRHGDEGAQAAALEALERITGASIVDASLEAEHARGEEPFVGRRPPYEEPGILDGDPDAWQAWWERWGRAAEPEGRYRFGRPWTPTASYEEVLRETSLQRDRPWAVMELATRGGRPLPLDWHDLIVRQRAAAR